MKRKKNSVPKGAKFYALKAFFILLIIYILFTMFAPAIRWGYLKLTCQNQTSAEVYKIEKWDITNGGITYPAYRLYYRFQTPDSKLIEGATESNFFYKATHLLSECQGEISQVPLGPTVGDHITIYYNSQIPSRFYTRNDPASPFPGIWIAGISILLFSSFFVTQKHHLSTIFIRPVA
ncbi:hypothetical protein ABXS75_08980 [Roseburia hominis]